MAMTKVEAAKLTQDMMLRGVIETIITESMILELLPFMEIMGEVVTRVEQRLLAHDQR